MKKRQLGPCVTFFPQPTTLVTTQDGKGNANLMTASWAGIVSKTPPTMAVSLHHGRKTYENINLTGCFTVNVVPAELAVEADFCGLKSGRDLDKGQCAKLELEPASHVEAPLVVQSPLNVECRKVGEHHIGDYRLVFGEIIEIHAAEQAFREDGSMDALAFDPLVYLGGIREYWSLGELKGRAYEDGKSLFPSKK